MQALRRSVKVTSPGGAAGFGGSGGAVIDEKVIGFVEVVGDIDVGPAVVIEVGDGQSEAEGQHVGMDAGLGGDVGIDGVMEGVIPVAAIELALKGRAAFFSPARIFDCAGGILVQ